MPKSGEAARNRLIESAIALFTEQGYEHTSVAAIAARAGVTERTFYRHFADKREMFFDRGHELRDVLLEALAARPAREQPLPSLRAAFHASVWLFERNRPITEPSSRVIAATPALQERALAKHAMVVAALTSALEARGADPATARLCAQVGMDTLGLAVDRWLDDGTVPLQERIDEAFHELRRASAALT